jgi:hypothetical protein
VPFWRSGHPVDDATLNAYADGELGEAGRARVERHVDTCASCRDTIADLRSLSETLGALPAARAPRSFVLRESDVRPEPAPAFRRWQPTVSGLAIAAFATFFLLVGVDVFDVSTSNDEADGGGLLSAPEESDGATSGTPAAEEGDQPAPSQYDDGGTASDAGGEGFVAEPGEVRSPPGPAASPQPTSVELPDGDADEPTTEAGGRGEDAAEESGDDGGDTALRVAEGAAAAVALAASGTLAVAWWRRRAR